MPGKYYSVREALRRLNESNIDEEYEDNLSELDPEEDDEPITEEDKIFEQAMFEFFAELSEENDLVEEFKNTNALTLHYGNHCLANSNTKRSTRNNVYYDFNNVNKYQAREQMIVNLARESAIYVDSLVDAKFVLKAFKKLFEGNKTIVFSPFCCITNKNKEVITITLHSFATDVTTNYENNTIDYMITRRGKTRTLFPLDASYVENKFNNVVKRAFPNMHFDINH